MNSLDNSMNSLDNSSSTFSYMLLMNTFTYTMQPYGGQTSVYVGDNLYYAEVSSKSISTAPTFYS